MTLQDANHFTVKVKVGISYIKGVADVKMRLAEARRPEHAQYEGQGSVAGGNVRMIAGFDLSPAGAERKLCGEAKRRFSAALLRLPEGCLNRSARRMCRS